MERTVGRAWMIVWRRPLWKWRHFFLHLVLRDLRQKYRRSSLGFAWAFVNPMILFGIYHFVFSVVLDVPIEDYPFFLLSGLIPWLWFANSLTLSVSSLARDSNLIRKSPFPWELLPLRAIVVSSLDCFAGFAIVLSCLFVFRGSLPTSLLFLPLICLVQVSLMLCLVFPLALFGALSRDMEHLLSSFLRLLFFLTPIAYSLENVPQKYRALLELNPLAKLAQAFQDAIANGSCPEMGSLGLVALFCSIGSVFVFCLFKRLLHRLPEVV